MSSMNRPKAHSRVRTLLAIERVMQIEFKIPDFEIRISETEPLNAGEARIYVSVMIVGSALIRN